MSVYDAPFDIIIGKALNILFDKRADIFTFALYYDHEGHSVEALADTRENSMRVAQQRDEFRRSLLFAAIQNDDLEEAANWSCGGGRSFSLGDFAFGSLGWTAMNAPRNSSPFYRAMAQALIRNSHNIAALTRTPETLVLCCSNKNNEVGLSWVPPVA